MAKKRRFVNPFKLRGRWYKANLHTHTTSSDGRLSPAGRVKQYGKAGYDVLALTDHGTVNDLRGLRGKKMLLISGVEYHPECPTHGSAYHLVGLNVPRDFKLKGLTPNGFIRKVRRGGGEVILGHPFWCGYQLEDFTNLRGLAVVEVYNRACHICGRGSSENEWAHCLDRGMLLPAIAVDDAHSERDEAFAGWTMLKMPALTTRNVLRALRAGAFYASCGPKIHDFHVAADKVHVRCSPAAEIHIISAPAMGALCQARRGKTITSFTAAATRDWFGNKVPFVRARVTDTRGRMAWTNPIFLR